MLSAQQHHPAQKLKILNYPHIFEMTANQHPASETPEESYYRQFVCETLLSEAICHAAFMKNAKTKYAVTF